MVKEKWIDLILYRQIDTTEELYDGTLWEIGRYCQER
jgi:hypothetical protein